MNNMVKQTTRLLLSILSLQAYSSSRSLLFFPCYYELGNSLRLLVLFFFFGEENQRSEERCDLL